MSCDDSTTAVTAYPITPGKTLSLPTMLFTKDATTLKPRPLIDTDGATISAFVVHVPDGTQAEIDEALAVATAIAGISAITPAFVSATKEWLVEFLGSALTWAILDPIFNVPTPPLPFVVIVVTGQDRETIPLTWTPASYATLT